MPAMSERVAVPPHAASRPTAKVRGRRRSWIRRLAMLLFGVLVVIPVVLTLLFRFVPPPITPLMLGIRVMNGSIAYRWVPLEAISPNLVRAVIASEDGKF